ncbi:hypothetical protein ACJJTC_011567 [Scirpophaga incertulas]
MIYKPVSHVLFDMDGLILNTEELYSVGFEEIAARHGKKFTYSLKMNIMGKQSEELASSIINELGLPITVDVFMTESRIIFEKLFPQCKIMPGVERLIRHLRNNNVPIGLATSSSIESYQLKVRHHKELFDLLPYKTWGSSDPTVKLGKPHPDIFIVAASKFPDEPNPENCLVFEDSLNGVLAARAAGMQVVMVPDSRLDRKFTTDAHLVLDSVEEFRPEIFGLPAYCTCE